jgi:hypothetical protein
MPQLEAKMTLLSLPAVKFAALAHLVSPHDVKGNKNLARQAAQA